MYYKFKTYKMLTTRMIPNPTTLLVDVQEVYNIIEEDLVTNARDVVNRYEYYTHKYRGDLLNDINVGIFVNDNLKIVAQVYVSNGHDIIKTQLIFSNDGRRISAIDEIINTFKEPIMQLQLKVYDDSGLELRERLENKLEELATQLGFDGFDIVSRRIKDENVIFELKGIK